MLSDTWLQAFSQHQIHRTPKYIFQKELHIHIIAQRGTLQCNQKVQVALCACCAGTIRPEEAERAHPSLTQLGTMLRNRAEYAI